MNAVPDFNSLGMRMQMRSARLATEHKPVTVPFVSILKDSPPSPFYVMQDAET